MAFKTMVSVAAVAFALVATAGGAAAVPARSMSRQATAGATSVVGGGSPRVVLVPQGAIPFGKDKRGDEKKVNVMIDVDIEKEKEENPEYGYKKGDDEEVNVKIDVDVKKEKEEEKKEGVALVSGLTGVVSQPQVVPEGAQQQPGYESQ